MIIIGNKSGQLGNRLFVFAHFIANAIEFGYEIWNPSFYDYADYFESTRRDLFCRFPARRTRPGHSPALQAVLFNLVFYPTLLYQRLGLGNTRLRVVNIWRSHDRRGQAYDLTSEEFIRLLKNSRVLIAQGWLFRDFANVAKHAATLRQFFTPIESHAHNVARLIGAARRDCDVLVGAHIRQGDFANLSGGKYLYATPQYVEIFKRAAELWRGKRVKFLICSNARQDETLFQGLNYTMGNNHLVEDMYALARCDYLIGPPSTFTMWASFYGAVPLFKIETIDTPVHLNGFQVCQG